MEKLRPLPLPPPLRQCRRHAAIATSGSSLPHHLRRSSQVTTSLDSSRSSRVATAQDWVSGAMEEELGEFEDFEVVDESASSATRFRCTTSSVWTEFDKYKDGSGKERAKCKRCDSNYLADAQDEDERLVEDLESLCISQSDAHMDDE
ncbi:hypothetical protein RHMOL_Rhmol03G0201700 [Rhododendron molle]|uniref:Uncharacterized protein n=1 Tax=Rhododendron molle TaxID=49168 RepID=A0ACC0PG68_RHOML|nr:hypothetical protein RHMOL_Rhmol03G0201700 [Rhododendron molle]